MFYKIDSIYKKYIYLYKIIIYGIEKRECIMKQKKIKYYAIHHINTKKDYVVSTWKECVALTKGYPHIFKSFPTTEEANAWLQSITPLMEEKGKNYPKEKVQKFYAVHYSDTEENFVETSWKKCQKRMEDREKCYTMYKSFLSPTDAFDWLDNIDMDKEERWFLIVKKMNRKIKNTVRECRIKRKV